MRRHRRSHSPFRSSKDSLPGGQRRSSSAQTAIRSNRRRPGANLVGKGPESRHSARPELHSLPGSAAQSTGGARDPRRAAGRRARPGAPWSRRPGPTRGTCSTAPVGGSTLSKAMLTSNLGAGWVARGERGGGERALAAARQYSQPSWARMVVDLARVARLAVRTEAARAGRAGLSALGSPRLASGWWGHSRSLGFQSCCPFLGSHAASRAASTKSFISLARS